MPPKLEQASPSDFQSVLVAIRNAAADPDKAAACLQSALGWGQAQLPKDAGAQWEFLASLNKLASSQELVLRTAAIKVIARLTSITWQAQSQLHTQENAKVAWAVIYDQATALFDQPITRVTADGSLAKKVPAMPVKGSPAETVSSLAALPRQAVDAALRILTELALRDTQEHLGWMLQGLHMSFKNSVGECEASPVNTILSLLKVPSSRIQHRAVQLMGILAVSKPFQAALTEASAVQPLLGSALENSNASVRLASIQVLQKLLSNDPAGLQQLVTNGFVKQLVELVVFASQELKAYTAAQALAAAAPVRSGAGKQVDSSMQGVILEYSKPVVTSPADVQLAALQLLGTVCHYNQSATEQLALQGGLQLLMSMMPSSVISTADTPDTQANNNDAPPQQRGRSTPSLLPPVTAAEDSNNIKVENPWENCLSIQMPPLPLLPSTAAQVAALRVVSQLLSIPELASVLTTQLASIFSSGQSQPVDEASQAAASEVEPAAAWDSGTVSKPQQEHVVQQLLHLFSGAQLPVTTDDMAAKGNKSTEKPKLSGKGKGEVQDIGDTLPSHLLPPFSAEVRGATMDAIAAFALQPEAAKWLADSEEVGKMVQRCGRPGSNALALTDSTKAAPPTIAIDVVPDTCTTAAEVQLAHGLSLLLLRTHAVESSWRHSNADIITKLAAASVGETEDYRIKTALASAALTVPDQELVAPPRPPLPSPPGTPPPLPLATSIFVWDALDRPMMADGKAKLTYI